LAAIQTGVGHRYAGQVRVRKAEERGFLSGTVSKWGQGSAKREYKSKHKVVMAQTTHKHPTPQEQTKKTREETRILVNFMTTPSKFYGKDNLLELRAVGPPPEFQRANRNLVDNGDLQFHFAGIFRLSSPPTAAVVEWNLV
jgi:hypothetical protein